MLGLVVQASSTTIIFLPGSVVNAWTVCTAWLLRFATGVLCANHLFHYNSI